MNKKKLLALLMALVMTLSLVPVTAFATEEENVDPQPAVSTVSSPVISLYNTTSTRKASFYTAVGETNPVVEINIDKTAISEAFQAVQGDTVYTNADDAKNQTNGTVFARQGYTLIGWRKDSSTLCVCDLTYNINSPTKFYALWENTSPVTDIEGLKTQAENVDSVNLGASTIVLDDDLTLAGSSMIVIDSDVTLDLNGWTLRNQENRTVILVQPSGHLTIQDSSANKDGKITASTKTIYSAGTTTLDSGNIVASGDSAIRVSGNDGKAIINGGTVTAANQTIYMDKDQGTGYTEINGGTVESTKVSTSSSAVYALNANLKMTGGTVESKCFAFYLEDYNPSVNKCVISGGTVTSTTALFTGLNNPKLEISGGTFTSQKLTKDNWSRNPDNFSFTGGTFSADPTACVATGYEAVDNGNGTWTVKAKDYVAQIGETNYETLEAAFAAAVDGDTITLLAGVTLDSTVEIADGKSVTLDLNNQNVNLPENAAFSAFFVSHGTLDITGSGLISGSPSNYKLIYLMGSTEDVANYSNLTIGEHVTVNCPNGYAVMVSANGNAGYGVNITVNGTLTAAYGGPYVNGSITAEGTNIPVVTLTSTSSVTAIDGTAIYAAGTAQYNLAGNVSGKECAIEIRAGELNITGGNYSSSVAAYNCNANGSGTTTEGAALAIAQHTTKKDIAVSISGGTFSGYYAISESNPQKNDPAPQVTMSITGGQFTGTNENKTAIIEADLSKCISGGIFSAEPAAAYIAENYKAVNGEQAGWYQVVAAGSAVAKIGDVEYATLQGAFNAGGNVTLLRNVVLSAPAVVTENVNLDMANHTINNVSNIWAGGNWSLISVQEGGNLTVTGNGTVSAKANDCYAFDVRNGGKLTIENGTFVGNISAVYVINESGSDKSELTVNGGTFSIIQLSDYNDYRYTLNCRDEYYQNGTAKITVKGGTFEGFDPSNCLAEGANTNFVAEGYEAVENNGTWTVQAKAVAQIGEVQYTTLAAAIAAANEMDEATVTLLRDYDMETYEPGYGWTTLSHSARENCLVISGDVTFDLSGYTLSNLFNNTFKITGNVTIQNGEMKVGKYNNDAYCSYVMMTDTGATLTVNDLTTFGGINVSGATATINNLSFSGTTFYAVCSQDGASVTLNGGTYNKAIPGAANNMFWVENGSTMNITGGNYVKGSAKFISGEPYPVITGGTFDFNPTNNGVADGYEAVDNGNGTWTVQAKPVAKIGDVKYTTLADAIKAVPKDGTQTTITLLDDVGGEAVAINGGRNIVLDLNSHTVNANSMYVLNGALEVKGGEIKNSVNVYGLDTEGSMSSTFQLDSGATISADYGVILREYPNTKAAYNATVTIDGTVNGCIWVMGNICEGDSVVNVNGTVNAKGTVGLALQGYATANVNSSATIQPGTTKAGTGIEVRGGTLNVSGGTISGNGSPASASANGNGTTSAGAGIAISTYNNSDINVNISGGTISGYSPLYLVNTTGKDHKLNVSVSGGTFTLTNEGTAVVAVNEANPEDRAVGFITGGIFSAKPAATYVAEGYEAVAIGNDWYQVGEIKSTAIAKTTADSDNTHATYTASREVVDENALTIGDSYKPTVTVNLSASAGTVATNNELPRYDQEKIVAKALEVSNAATMNVSIDVKHDEPSVVDNKITYEVHPEATVTSGNETVGTFTVTNDMLSGQTFTIKLPVPEALQAKGWVKVTHRLNNNSTVVYDKLKVDNGYVTIADVTEFSEFELEMIVVDSTPSASYGFTLALKDKIEIPFYVYNLSDNPSAYTVEYSYTNANGVSVDNTVNLNESAYSVGNGWYRVVVASFSARQIRDTVHVVLKANGSEIYSVDYSVSQYCTGMIEGGTNTESLKTLCKAMMDYGTAAQWNFGYNTAQASNYTYYLLNSTEAMGSQYSNSFNTENSKVFSYIGATLSLRSQTELNFYFTLRNVNINNYTVKVNGVEADVQSAGSYYKVTASGITAKNLDKQVTVTVTNKDTSEVESYSYSPLNYAYYIQENSPTDTLKTVCSGLYLYWQAANDYLK